MDRLLEAIYGEDLPPTSRSQAQISISSLRRLFASHSHDAIISTHAHGYVIQVDSEQLDSQQFERLVAAARAAREADHLDQAVACYRDALRLWRGPALDGIDSQLLRVAATGWTSSASPPTRTASSSNSSWAGITSWSASSPSSSKSSRCGSDCAAS